MAMSFVPVWEKPTSSVKADVELTGGSCDVKIGNLGRSVTMPKIPTSGVVGIFGLLINSTQKWASTKMMFD
jgi:hypothetical protein